MTKIQYIAIRTILDYEIEVSQKDNGLAEVLTLLFDDEKQLKKTIDYDKRSDAAKVVATATSAGLAVTSILPALVPLIGAAAVKILIKSSDTKVRTGQWIEKILK
jgi:hypothetical protein